MMYADKDWYSSLCENYTHVNAGTKPNAHNDKSLPHAGGVLQPAGLERSLDELVAVLGFVAMPICRYFNFDDLFEELTAAVHAMAQDAGPAS